MSRRLVVLDIMASLSSHHIVVVVINVVDVAVVVVIVLLIFASSYQLRPIISLSSRHRLVTISLFASSYHLHRIVSRRPRRHRVIVKSRHIVVVIVLPRGPLPVIRSTITMILPTKQHRPMIALRSTSPVVLHYRDMGTKIINENATVSC